jgi:hypothetical protein
MALDRYKQGNESVHKFAPTKYRAVPLDYVIEGGVH